MYDYEVHISKESKFMVLAKSQPVKQWDKRLSIWDFYCYPAYEILKKVLTKKSYALLHINNEDKNIAKVAQKIIEHNLKIRLIEYKNVYKKEED